MADNKKHVCPRCGSWFFKVCIKCRLEDQAETVVNLLDAEGYNDKETIRQLCIHAKDGNIQAIKEIITLRGMRPAAKLEATGAGGGPLEFAEVKGRMPGLLSRLKKVVDG